MRRTKRILNRNLEKLHGQFGRLIEGDQGAARAHELLDLRQSARAYAAGVLRPLLARIARQVHPLQNGACGLLRQDEGIEPGTQLRAVEVIVVQHSKGNPIVVEQPLRPTLIGVCQPCLVDGDARPAQLVRRRPDTF